MTVDTDRLRRRLPRELRERLPEAGSLTAWLEVLGEEFGDLIVRLESGELEAALAEIVGAGERAVGALTRAEERSEDRRARKAIRRAMHRLRSRGVAVAPEPAERRGSVLRPLEEQRERAFVTPIDPAGQRLVFLVDLSRGGARILQVIASDTEGILQVEPLQGRRRDARRFVERLLTQKPSRALPVDPTQARAWLRRAESVRTGPPPSGLDTGTLARLIAGPPAPTPGESVREQLGSRTVGEGVAEATLRQRMERGSLPAWPLRGDAIDAAARRLQSAERGPLVLSPAQQRERHEAILAEEAGRVLGTETRELLAARLEESAAWLLERDDEEGARAAIEIASALRSARPALDVGYLRGVLEMSLKLAGERLQEEDKGKLIVPG